MKMLGVALGAALLSSASAKSLGLSGYICPTCPSAPHPDALLTSLPAAYTVVNIAFIGWDTNGTIINQFDSKPKNFTLTKAKVAALQKQGKQVLISAGGGAGGQIVASAPAGFADNMAKGMLEFVDRYGFDGVDFDMEHRAGDIKKCAAIVNSVLKQLKAAKPDIKISFAPQCTNLDPSLTIVAAGWNALVPVIGPSLDMIDRVQPQLYNGGGETLAFATSYTAGLLKGYTAGGVVVPPMPPAKLWLGYPASPSGAGSGYIDPCKVVANVLAMPVPVYGLMTWDIGWDQQASWHFANCVAKGNAGLLN